jgi:ATP-dependent DNA ligase
MDGLPFQPPLEPMLAAPGDAFPEGAGWIYEPKWDGFRALVFRDGDDVFTQSRDLKPLDRYFPELVVAFRAQLPERCVLDGEIVVAQNGRLEFEQLQLRLHPAKSRVDKLSYEIPASFVAFDLLALGDEDLRQSPQRVRREKLEAVMREVKPPLHLTPITRDLAVAKDWFVRFEGAGLDGVIAKPDDLVYQPKKRAMMKLKHVRTCDCVVAGFRWHKEGEGIVGSLLLGLYDAAGRLQHVGVTSSFTMAKRRELAELLAPYRENAMEGHPWQSWAEVDHRQPGMQSRWSAGKDMSWVAVRAERVCEVKFDHLEGSRFRHASTFVRWRDDKPPRECGYDQIATTPPFELAKIFGGA